MIYAGYKRHNTRHGLGIIHGDLRESGKLDQAQGATDALQLRAQWPGKKRQNHSNVAQRGFSVIRRAKQPRSYSCDV